MDIVLQSFWTFLGSIIILFFILAIVLKFKPIQVNKYFINDEILSKKNLNKILDKTLDDEGKPDRTVNNVETSMNDSVWKILLDIL